MKFLVKVAVSAAPENEIQLLQAPDQVSCQRSSQTMETSGPQPSWLPAPPEHVKLRPHVKFCKGVASSSAYACARAREPAPAPARRAREPAPVPASPRPRARAREPASPRARVREPASPRARARARGVRISLWWPPV